MPTNSRRRPESHRAILDAANQLLAERGVAGLTIEGVAKLAGVGKQTIYRWWPTKGDLAVEAYLARAELELPPPPAGDTARRLRALVRGLVTLLGDTDSGSVVAGLIAEAQHDADFGERFRVAFISRRREILREILATGQTRGEVRHDLDLDLAIDLVYGTVIYRLLFRHAPMNRKFADDLVVSVLVVLAP